VTRDPRFQLFAVTLRDDYSKTGTQNTKPEQRCTDAPLLCHKKEIHYLRIGVLVFGMWCYVERTRMLNPVRRWKCSVFILNMWNQTPHKQVWYTGGLKSSITMLWKPQKSKIHYLLYTTWQSKSLHYETFYNTTDLTFHSNKIISLHIKAQNLIAQIPKLWLSGEHWQTHNQCMYLSLPNI